MAYSKGNAAFASSPGKSWKHLRDHLYHDPAGREILKVSIWHKPDGKKTAVQSLPDDKGGWRKPVKGEASKIWTLYRLHLLLQAKPDTVVYLTEGEKDVERLAAYGLLATTTPGGAKNWRDDYAVFLKGRKVIIVPDNDQDGERYAQDAGKSLLARGCDVKILRLPGLPEKGDVSDWLNAGHTIDEFKQLAAAAPDFDHIEKQTIRVTQLSTVKPERVDFIWRPFIPLGRPVSIEGRPDVGKSSLVSKIIAHITTGKAFPNVIEGAPPPSDFAPRNVCLFTSEDDPADTIRPRIAVNGGDPARIYLIDGWEQPDGEQGIVTLRDLDKIKETLETYQPVLIVFDPLQSFFGRGDMNKANDTRPVLDAIRNLCRGYDCTPMYVRHVGKMHREAIHAGLGSIDITANMRSALFLGDDPDNPFRRIIGHFKHNNSQPGQSLAYRIESVVESITTPEGDTVEIEAPRLLWDGLSNLTADDLSSPQLINDEEKSALEQAEEFLVELLSSGAVLSSEIREHSKEAGISWATIRRAKSLAGVKSRQRQEPGESVRKAPWEWYLPEYKREGDSSIGTNRMSNNEQVESSEQNQILTDNALLAHVSNNEQVETNEENQALNSTCSTCSSPAARDAKQRKNGNRIGKFCDRCNQESEWFTSPGLPETIVCVECGREELVGVPF